MNLEQLASHIKSPETLGVSSLEDTKFLIEKYPYASTVHILRLKTLANANHIDFEDELKIAAAHVSDREHLFHLINDSSETQDKFEEAQSGKNLSHSEKIEVNKPVELKEEKVELITEEKKVTESMQPKSSQDPSDIQELVANEENELRHSDDKQEPIDFQNKEEEKTVEDTDLSTLDEEIMSHVVSAAFEKAADKLIPEKEKTEPVLEVEDQEFTDAKIETEQIEPIEVQTEVINTSDLSFVEWLQLKQTKKLSPTTAATTEKIQEPAESTPKGASLKSAVNSEEKQMSKKEINALLDRFIEEQPSISRPQKEFFSPSENAKHSLEESGEIVSETLAQIHVMQGNYKKAISAYKQLSLLYPEKKTFFASQIEKIKDKTT